MAQADNVLFLYRNYVDEATLTASSAATPVDRVKDFRPGRVWTAAGFASETVTVDCGADVQMTHAAAAAFNLNAAGSIRVEVSAVSDFSTLLYDSDDVEAWPPVAGFGTDGFGNSLGGYPVLTGINDYRPYRVFAFGETLIARHVRFTFDNPGLGTGIQVGRLFVGLGVQPEVNFGYDWSTEWVDPSEIIDTEESFFIVRRKKYRVLRLSLPRLTTAEALGSFDDLKRIVGRSRDLFVMLFPTGSVPTQYRTTIYGVPIENGAISNPYVNGFSTSIAIRELAR
ncbi:hypothetical protein [Arenibaculum pallidiluteum]|uniref:hypothetical protein n=1 Tax=Arenibaculum pallidiluteum TaxID=2812559 RepID=UPI001A977B43|nr:hypothetical protein [Arenibaculum pallidiluteum]